MAALALAANALAITVTIDATTRYQTIVGFGGRVFATPQNASDIVNDAGLSAVRFDWCAAGNGVDDARPYTTAGCRTVIGSCWSPPANLKDNHSIANGSLPPANYSAFADFTIQQLQKFRTDYGFELYALSPQNEPRFDEPYGSCVYSGPELIAITDTLGRRIQAAGLHTRLFLPEDVYSNWSSFNQYIVPDSANLRKYVTAIAFHGYTSNGVTPAQMNPSNLARIHGFASTYGWQAWMSENEGDAGMQYALDVVACLRYGKVSLYSGVVLSHSASDDDKAYMTASTKNLTYYVAKCFNRFIRPGSVQLRSWSPDSASFANFVAFYDSAASALAVSMVTGSASQSVTLQGANLPGAFQKWVTNASTLCVNQGTVAGDAAIAIPANSVVTLYGTGYAPVAVSSRTAACSTGPRAQAPSRMYDLTGRRLLPGTPLRATGLALASGSSGSRTALVLPEATARR